MPYGQQYTYSVCPVHLELSERARVEERREVKEAGAVWAEGKETRDGSGSRYFNMEEGQRPTSEIYLPSISLGSVDTETVEDHELPIISLSKSSTEMVSGPPQRTELACLRVDPTLDTPLIAERMCHKTPVKEVEWDAEGMTWEVYGAAVDPEELGLAIQKHLELQIKETAAAAAVTAQKEDSTDNVSSLALQPRQRKKSEGIIRTLRSSACCSNASTVGD
ncbi:hypothetical protein cypCar_00006917 [Cyprinus carpio]|nr:hypothetical protein cypCar_00006917 [Cyprinus carpio]